MQIPLLRNIFHDLGDYHPALFTSRALWPWYRIEAYKSLLITCSGWQMWKRPDAFRKVADLWCLWMLKWQDYLYPCLRALQLNLPVAFLRLVGLISIFGIQKNMSCESCWFYFGFLLFNLLHLCLPSLSSCFLWHFLMKLGVHHVKGANCS